jgi:hypothetical protein
VKVFRGAVFAAIALLIFASAPPRATASTRSAPPTEGYFALQPVGAWSELPGDRTCSRRVQYSEWEPRPDNTKRNHTLVSARAVHASFAARPLSQGGNQDPRWDSWLLPRVDGQFTGTTDEIFQWAACKWGLSDNLLRAIAFQESTWYQYEAYPSGRPVVTWGSGDMMPAGTPGSDVYCAAVARYGYEYQGDFGAGICPQTFSIVGIKSWQNPTWGLMPDNQNGTFPFNRDSTAFALDYLASDLRGCLEGWEPWLDGTGPVHYRAGDVWGCVGSWYAGEWRTTRALGYAHRVRRELRNRTWLESDWKRIGPSCSTKYGCPRGS